MFGGINGKFDANFQSSAQRESVSGTGRLRRSDDASGHGEQDWRAAALRGGGGGVDVGHVAFGNARSRNTVDDWRYCWRLRRGAGHRLQKRMVSGDFTHLLG